jgi:hypothetical protein
VTNVRAGLGFFILLTLIYAAVLFFAWGELSLVALCRWDCAWYVSILSHGYVSTLPPIAQSLDQANVAFFPLYPFVGRELTRLFGLSPEAALPILSMVFAAGVFFVSGRILDIRRDPLGRKKLLLLAAYPASFYLFVGYSEALYIFFLLLAFYAVDRATRSPMRESRAWLTILALSAFFLGLTRLTGFVVGAGAAVVCFVAGFLRSYPQLRSTSVGPGRAPFVWATFSVLGVATFFAYCQTKFGVWDLYFRTLDVGWNKEASIPGFFHFFFRAIQKNVLPHWFAKEPMRMSWVITADLIIVLIYVLYAEGKRLWRSRLDAEPFRVFTYAVLAAVFVHLLITTIGDSGGYHRWRNGMRYSMPVFFLFVLLWEESWMPEGIAKRPGLKKALWYACLTLFIPYQIYYFWLFIRGGWVS